MKENEEVMEKKYECSTMITTKLMELTFFHISENSPSFFGLA
ncbi:hypothetical protein ABS315_01335 [Peribacillus frigoritolerans]